jgi:ATP-dependent DNA helicase RecG
MADFSRAQRCVRWDEAFVLQAELARRRAETRALPAVARRGVASGLAAELDARLPFELTPGQRSVGDRLALELSSPHPMNRLLQGEVGTGKTVVALRAMLIVIDSGGQVALLAPTEVLAQQHYRSITAMLGPLAQAGQLGGADIATRVLLLTGSMPAGRRRDALLEVERGHAGIVVGTHALLQENVTFRDLGLVVVDEQHRFGVEQRDLLRAKARADRTPHVLVMTATPIPRTIAMTVFGDLDVSTLRDQPVGRAGVATHLVPADNERYLARTWQRVREEVAAGHQAFVVCPQISRDQPGGDEDVPVDDDGFGDRGELDEGAHERSARPPVVVLDLLPELRGGPLAGLRVEPLHGRMAPDQKDDVMRRFAGGKIDVLVATTVIEVGVDVPNATAMVIMDAHRFGISQLHQLRGRIGRGTAPGICLLVSPAEPDAPSGRRIQAVAASTDGFKLAEEDLNLRREGDVLGRSQSGWRTSLRNLRVLRDSKIITEARDEALRLVDQDPTLEGFPDLVAALDRLAERERAEFLERG